MATLEFMFRYPLSTLGVLEFTGAFPLQSERHSIIGPESDQKLWLRVTTGKPPEDVLRYLRERGFAVVGVIDLTALAEMGDAQSSPGVQMISPVPVSPFDRGMRQ